MTKYLERFRALNHELLPLRGNRMIVEVLPKEDIKTKGGIVLASSTYDHKTSTEQNRAKLAIVLATGSGYYDEETGADVDMDVKVGSVVLVSEMGLKYYSEFPGIGEYTGETIALTRESEVHVAWPTIEVFQEYKKTLALRTEGAS